jgi:hypothetical protein
MCDPALALGRHCAQVVAAGELCVVQEGWERRMHEAKQDLEAAAVTWQQEHQKLIAEKDERFKIELQSAVESSIAEHATALAKAQVTLQAERDARAAERQECEVAAAAVEAAAAQESAKAEATRARDLEALRIEYEPMLASLKSDLKRTRDISAREAQAAAAALEGMKEMARHEVGGNPGPGDDSIN